MSKTQIAFSGLDSSIEMLKALPKLLAGDALEKGLEKGLRPVARTASQLCPLQPEKDRKKSKRGEPHLRDTITVKTRSYGNGTRKLGVVGPNYPKGAHGHLLEWGHRVGVHPVSLRSELNWELDRLNKRTKQRYYRRGKSHAIVHPRKSWVPAVKFMMPAWNRHKNMIPVEINVAIEMAFKLAKFRGQTK